MGTRSGVLVTIGKDTTYITAPLRPDGYPDYIAALEPASQPRRDAREQFGRALPAGDGPNDIPPTIRQRYFEMLGIPPLPPTAIISSTSDEYARGRAGPCRLGAGRTGLGDDFRTSTTQ